LWIYQHRNDRLIKKTTKTHQPISNDEIKEIFKDKQGYYWILTANGVTTLTQNLEVKDVFLYNKEKPLHTSAIAEAPDGTIWLGSFGQGLFFKPPGAAAFQLFTGLGNTSLKNNLVIETLLADQQGMIWLGAFTDGLY